MPLNGADDQEKMKDLCSRTYKDQAIWILNGFWAELPGSQEAETFWKNVNKASEFDEKKKKEGNELDEFAMHRFLEFFKDPMTIVKLREEIRKIGINKFNYIPLTHYFIVKYKLDWHKTVNAPQGCNEEEVKEAQRLLNEAKVALQELQAQEDAYNNKTNNLRIKSEDQTTTLVNRNKAKAELAQHLAEDPLPLRKAKTTAEAAVRKAEKYLEEVKKKEGAAQGALWWISRELEEAKKYMPQKKGGVSK